MSSAARLVAFEGMVRLMRWESTSTAGDKAKFALTDRDALGPFEKATKRRGKKAGTHYLLLVSDSLGEPIKDTPDECYLAGAQWAHGTGASITLGFASIDYWRRHTTDDEGAGEQFHFTLVELQDDQTPVDQTSADAVEKANKPKGGPKSKHVAQRNQTTDFQAFVGYRTDIPRDRWNLVGADTCDKWVKQMCGVESKVEFDHDHEKWVRYEKLIGKPFLSWARAEYGESYGL